MDQAPTPLRNRGYGRFLATAIIDDTDSNRHDRPDETIDSPVVTDLEEPHMEDEEIGRHLNLGNVGVMLWTLACCVVNFNMRNVSPMVHL